MDDLDRTAIREPLAPVGGRPNRGPIVGVIAAALVVVAIAVPKPWTPATLVGAPPVGSTGDAGDGSSGPRGSAGPADPYEPLRSICGSPGGWRAATLHRWPNRASPIRTWSAIEPAAATGPEDSDIPFVDVVAVVSQLGYCSPRGVTAAPDDTRAEIWSLRPGASVKLDPRLVEPDEPHPLGGFWAPPAGARTQILGVEAWRPGSYVIRLRGTAFDRWLGIEIREPPGPPEPEPGPPGTPDPLDPTTPAASPSGS